MNRIENFTTAAIEVAAAAVCVSSPVPLDEDRFWDHFRPIKNHLDGNASWNGCMFETYGEELSYVHSVNAESPRRVWTILECDESLVVASGYHFVNRIGYLITEKPAEEGVDYEIVDQPV